jgi:hypothetical protein
MIFVFHVIFIVVNIITGCLAYGPNAGFVYALRPRTSGLIEHLTLSTKIINQLLLFVTYRVYTAQKVHYMFRLYGHPQVYHIYKNAKIIIIT